MKKGQLLKYSNLATNVALHAGELAKYLQNFELNKSMKYNFKDIVTDGDIKAEKYIVGALSKTGLNILTEETGYIDNGKDLTWIIDPIDGTTQYYHGHPGWGVSIALSDGDEISLGVLYFPHHNQLYTGIKSQGAYLNGSPIKVSDTKELSSALVDIAYLDNMKRLFLLAEKVYDNTQKTLIMGSHAESLANISNGSLDASIALSSNCWDYAAGDLIINESGGVITDFNGEKIQYDNLGKPKLKHILATNGYLHEEILKYLANVNLDEVIQK
jgi:myo-inositol-1(or 4)-monophosphatase